MKNETRISFYPLAGLVLTLFFYQNAPATDFYELIDIALKSDPEYAIKQSEVRTSEASLTLATAQFLPDLTLSASQSQIGENHFKQGTKYQSYLVNSNWNIFKFGADWSNRNSAQSLLAAKKAALTEYQIQFESNFSETLFSYINVVRLLQIKDEQYNSQQRLLEIAQQRFRRGYFARQEVDKLEIDLDFIESELTDLKNKKSALLSEINKRVESLPQDLKWPWIEKVFEFKTAPLNIETHPSYIVRSHQYNSANSEYSQTTRQFWGSLDLNLQLARTNQMSDNLGNQEFNNQAATYLTFSIPLFNKMKDWSSRKFAFEKMNQSENLFNQTKENLTAQYRKSIEVFENNKQNMQKRIKTLKTSRALLDDNVARFQQGRISANDLSIDQNRVFLSEQVAATSIFNAHLALKNFCMAIGKPLKDCL